jgi:hypothetical protein
MDPSQPLPPDPSQPASGTTVVAAPVVTANDGPVTDPTEVKPSWLWIKGADGNGSVSTTLVTVAFLITSIAYILSIVDHVGGVSFRPFDAGACAAYFTPICALYFGRHWVDTNAKNPVTGG